MYKQQSHKQVFGQLLKRRTIHQSLAAFLLSSSILATPLHAAANDRRVATERFTEYARVINVQPVYQEVRIREPRRECWTEQEERIVGYESTTRYNRGHTSDSSQQGRSAGNTVIGGLIGGVIGNQLGRGHSNRSRAGATVAGAIIGSAIGNESGARTTRHRRHTQHRESRPIYETTPVERCKRVVESHSERQLQHYNVTYRYKGRDFVTQLPRDPGDRLELQVSVAPARR